MLKDPLRALLVAACVVVMVLAGLTGLIIYEMRLREERSAQEQLGAFDTLLAEQTARAVESVDLVVNQVVEELRLQGVTSSAAFDALRTDRAIYERLRQHIANIPQLEAITLDSSRGHLINMSRYFPSPDVDITDRDYFLALQDHPSSDITISAPVQNRGSGTWDIYFARRISGPQGEFVGLVLGAMTLEYFERLYESISMAGNTSISLWRDDGTLLARYPRTPFIGHRVAARDDLPVLPTGQTVVRSDVTDLDGQPHLSASRKLAKVGLVVEVSQTMREVFADWRHDALVVAVAGLTCIFATLLFAVALYRQFRTYREMEVAVAAREEAIQARRVAEERLLESQKMEAIGRLTSGLAHDFNNLLGSVTGNVELLQRDPIVSATASRRLLVIQQAADRGAALVRQLLAFSRQQVLAPAPVSLDRALAAMAELLDSTVGGAVTLEIALDPDVWRVTVDPAQFEYLVLNLAVNARDAMPEGGRLTIAAHNVRAGAPNRPEGLPDGDFVAISVSDTGTGMPEDVLRHAFDPFFTTKPPGRGSGLGLSQVYGLATQSGGLAVLRSKLGRGTTVSVFLPRDTAAADRVGASRHILLVEDDAVMREALAALLRDSGFVVTEAADGAAALTLVQGGLLPEVLLVDQNMPGMSGPVLARRLRERLRDVVVVLMTGDAETEAARGERWVIQKPFDTRRLTTLLRQAGASVDAGAGKEGLLF